MLFDVGLLQELLGFLRRNGFEGDLLLIPIEFGSFLSGRTFLLGSILRSFLLLQFLLFLSLLLHPLLVLRLLVEGLGRIYQTLFNIFLGYVFGHAIILYRRGNSYNLQQLIQFQ